MTNMIQCCIFFPNFVYALKVPTKRNHKNSHLLKKELQINQIPSKNYYQNNKPR